MMDQEANLKKHWGWFLTLGIVFIIAGTIAIILPGLASYSLELIIGWILVIAGFFQIIHSFGSKKWGSFFLRLLAGLCYLAAGVLLLLYPLSGLLTLTIILAAVLVVQGIFRIIFSFQIQQGAGNRAWVFISGLIGLALGLFIFFEWPFSALWILGLFLGIDLIFAGWTMVLLAVGTRKSA